MLITICIVVIIQSKIYTIANLTIETKVRIASKLDVRFLDDPLPLTYRQSQILESRLLARSPTGRP